MKTFEEALAHMVGQKDPVYFAGAAEIRRDIVNNILNRGSMIAVIQALKAEGAELEVMLAQAVQLGIIIGLEMNRSDS